jgi:transposase
MPRARAVASTALGLDVYRGRNVIERCFARLKQLRDPTTRYTKRLAYWRSELVIATIILWLR